MLYIKSLNEAEDVFKSLSAPMRLKIMEMIYEDKEWSMNDLAEALDLTNSAISMHVSKLEQAGLVTIQTKAGKRGNLKIVKPNHSRMMIDLAPIKETRTFYQDDIRVGHYSNYQITPTCGIATPTKIIGTFDDPRFFNFSERFDAGILWFGSGFIEYNLPNHLKAGQTLDELQISFELSSEYPGFNNDYPSDIYFSINGISLGLYVSPGDYGERKGFVTPNWWPDTLNQYGLLKTLIINKEGTFIDGSDKISDTTITELEINYISSISFRFEVPKDAANCGGFTLFGENFGDYNQAIRVKAFYTDHICEKTAKEQ
ncbi:MAG: metalloregulator ArsR/SmtB family transcription factor [Clostridiales bacterium]|nr:metalloregulator ArsR/SmtB family transcription factor [Clostridiales bacterium]